MGFSCIFISFISRVGFARERLANLGGVGFRRQRDAHLRHAPRRLGRLDAAITGLVACVGFSCIFISFISRGFRAGLFTRAGRATRRGRLERCSNSVVARRRRMNRRASVASRVSVSSIVASQVPEQGVQFHSRLLARLLQLRLSGEAIQARLDRLGAALERGDALENLGVSNLSVRRLGVAGVGRLGLPEPNLEQLLVRLERRAHVRFQRPELGLLRQGLDGVPLRLQRLVERHERKPDDVLNVTPLVQALRQVLHHERAGVAALVAVAAAEGRGMRRHRDLDEATTAPARWCPKKCCSERFSNGILVAGAPADHSQAFPVY